jgi:hypothetical protein
VNSWGEKQSRTDRTQLHIDPQHLELGPSLNPVLIPAEHLSPSSQKGAGRVHLFGAVLMYLARSGGVGEIAHGMAQSYLGTVTQWLVSLRI